jgi:DNA-binding transcriptional LysR family regulator
LDRLTSLTAFVSVVDSGGFSAAAQRLGLSPTMVGNHVQSLENRLGARLLNRTTRKVALTEIGRDYYERSKQILAELDEADRIAGDLQVSARGTLRLHCDTNIARFLAPVIVRFLADNPGAAVDLRVGAQMINMIDEGFDLAVRPTPPPDSSLVSRRLTGWHHVLCCAPHYLDSHPAPKSPADLEAHNCLRYAHYPFGDEWRFLAAGGKPISVKITGNLVTTSADTLRTVALSGGGLLFAPTFVAAEDLKAGRFVPLLPGFQGAEFSIDAIYPHRRHLAAKVRCFIDLLAAHFAEHRSWVDLGGIAGRR